MKIMLTAEEAENHFFDAMCNALAYVQGYGLELDINHAHYNKALATLKAQRPNETICFEEVLMQMLRQGDGLTMKDIENEGEYTRTIHLKEVHERVANTPVNHLMDAINENGDATTADVILQTVFFEEVVFG